MLSRTTTGPSLRLRSAAAASSVRRCTALRIVAAAAPTAAKPKFFTNPRSRSQIVEWMAKELKLTYDSVNIDLATGENKKPAYLAVNPFGKLPAIQAEDGTPIFESGAILLYLADKYGGPSTAEERATAAQWVLFANSTFGPAMFNANQRARDMPAFFAALDKLLGQHTWLAGSEFTVSDVAMGAYIAYYEIFIGDGLNTKYANVTRFMNAIKERPAFAATIGSEYNH